MQALCLTGPDSKGSQEIGQLKLAQNGLQDSLKIAPYIPFKGLLELLGALEIQLASYPPPLGAIRVAQPYELPISALCAPPKTPKIRPKIPKIAPRVVPKIGLNRALK